MKISNINFGFVNKSNINSRHTSFTAKRLTFFEREQVVQEYSKGTETKEIAKKWDITPKQIYYYVGIEQDKTKIRSNRMLNRNVRKESIFEEFRSGKSCEEISKMFKVTSSRIREILVDEKTKNLANYEKMLEERKINKAIKKLSTKQSQEIIELYKSGYRKCDISRMLNISIHTVCETIKMLDSKEVENQHNKNLKRNTDPKLSERNKEIIESYKRGKSTLELAQIYNLSRVSIYKILERAGLDLRNI